MALTTAAKIAEELNISRSYLYFLRKNGVFNLVTKNGRPQWDTSVIEIVKAHMSANETEQVDAPHCHIR